MEIAHFECPECGQKIDVAAGSYKSGIRCPSCNAAFVPDVLAIKVEPDAPRWPRKPVSSHPASPLVERSRASEIAGWLELVAYIAWAGGTVATFLMFINNLGNENAGSPWVIFGGTIGFGITAYLLAQLFHIRATLEVIANKK